MTPSDWLKTLADGAAARPGDWLWSIEPAALAQYVARTRQPDQRGARAIAPRQAGRVAVVPVQGVLVREAEYLDEVSTVALRRVLRELADDEGVAAVVLAIDSPGGSVAGLEELGDELARMADRKRLVAVSEGMVASAAYYLASHCHAIYARADHLIGSIGTRMLLYDVSGMFGEMGVEAVPIQTGPLKLVGALGMEITAEHRAYLQELVDDSQSRFTRRVSLGRGLTGADLDAVLSGRVWTGQQALAMKLIDGLQTVEQTVQSLTPDLLTHTLPHARTYAMSATATPDAPLSAPSVTQVIAQQRAALAKCCPGAPDEWISQHLEMEPAEATEAWIAHLTSERDAERKRADEAARAAAQAPKAAAAAPIGNQPLDLDASGDDGPVRVDFAAAVRQRMQETGCSRREAWGWAKRRWPEARAATFRPTID